MAILDVAPLEPGYRLQAPAQNFGATSGRAYVNRIGGQRIDLVLGFNNMDEERYGRLMAFVSRMLSAAPPELDARPATVSAFNARTAGRGYGWIPFRMLGFKQTDDRRVVASAQGARLTLDRAAPDGIEGEFLSLNGQPHIVESAAGSVVEVWPRPLEPVAAGHVLFDSAASPLGASDRTGLDPDPGPVGGWYTLPETSSPHFRRIVAQPQIGRPVELALQMDI